jgi:hypothetical protein
VLLLSGVSASAQDCSQLAPEGDLLLQTMESNRLKEVGLKTKLKGLNTTKETLALLKQYNDVINNSLTVVDDVETRANKVQELHCPGWDNADRMAETALVIKNIKARLKKNRSQVAANIAKYETAMKKRQRGMVSVSLD